jgi:hypothetical protein
MLGHHLGGGDKITLPLGVYLLLVEKDKISKT